MLKIDDKLLESQIKEILQNTTYSSPEEYLMARVAADHKTIKQKRKLDRLSRFRNLEIYARTTTLRHNS